MKRQNGAGTLIKTKTGLYIGKWFFEGKCYTKSLQTYDRKEAEKKLDELVRPFLDKHHVAVLQNIETRIQSNEINTVQTKDFFILLYLHLYASVLLVLMLFGTKLLWSKATSHTLAHLRQFVPIPA